MAGVRAASTEAFRLAMLGAAALVMTGGLINLLGISDRQARSAPDQAPGA
jgi:hypothetical protein